MSPCPLLPLKVGGHVPPAPMGAPPMVESIHCSTSLYNVHCSESLQTQLETVQCWFQSVLCSSCSGTAAVMVAAASGSRSCWQSGLAVGIQSVIEHNLAQLTWTTLLPTASFLSLQNVYHTWQLITYTHMKYKEFSYAPNTTYSQNYNFPQLAVVYLRLSTLLHNRYRQKYHTYRSRPTSSVDVVKVMIWDDGFIMQMRLW